MFNSQDYRTKAAEYHNRASKTQNPNEIREFKSLERTFNEPADNAQWVEQNLDKIVHSPAKEAIAGIERKRKARFFNYGDHDRTCMNRERKYPPPARVTS
jgi:hypothetical protein